MIQPNELRIGNYLQRLDDTFFKISAKDIQQIEGTPFNLRPKPIPLTEEWLLAFGFEKTKTLGSFLKNTPHTCIGYGITIHSQYPYDDKLFTEVIEIYQIDGSPVFVIGGLKHVHQLQNLYFALTGEELTLKTEL